MWNENLPDDVAELLRGIEIPHVLAGTDTDVIVVRKNGVRHSAIITSAKCAEEIMDRMCTALAENRENFYHVQWRDLNANLVRECSNDRRSAPR